MASTYKVPIAVELLRRVDAGALSLAETSGALDGSHRERMMEQRGVAAEPAPGGDP